MTLCFLTTFGIHHATQGSLEIPYGIIICGANRYTVSVSEFFSDSCKLRPVIILWQCYLHIHIRVVKHVWRVIVSLGICVVVIAINSVSFNYKIAKIAS